MTRSSAGLLACGRPLSEAQQPLRTSKPAPAPPVPAPAPPPRRARAVYLRVLTWSFAFFNTVRVFAYVPTIWTLAKSHDSSQHSLWTWCTWFCANITMTLWLRERAGARLDRAAVVNLGNAAMCLAVIVLILAERA